MRILKNKDIPDVREEYLQKQDQKCGICNANLQEEDNTNKHLDHDHVTGKVRGVLCRRCNLLEGALHYRFRRSGHKGLDTDYVEWLEAHLAYLKRPVSMYEHPEHFKSKMRKFRNLKKEDQIQILMERGVELNGNETKDQLLKKFKLTK
jgi:hypothetical protein